MAAPQPLPVIFRAEPGCREAATGRPGPQHITAVFPTIPADRFGHHATCYAHVGQHSGCSRQWYWKTRPATAEEAAPLLRELRGIYEHDQASPPCRLVVVKRWTRHHDAARRAEASQ